MLNFQIAGSAGGYLLEHLLIESIGAVRGGGIFAWANANGVKSLLEDDVLDEFLLAGNFRLFVGTDSITDPPAIQKLIEISTKRPRLDVRAFMSPTSSLFHPKMAWFEHDDHLSLIVGSGNLTMGGLRSNWEAFVVLKLTGKERKDALVKVEDFLTSITDDLLPVTDPRVLERAKRNTGNERTLRPAATPSPASEGLAYSVDEVLVTDFTVSVGRTSQANFKRKDYEGFFGALVGSQRRISLRFVDSSGAVGEVESRPSVQAKSRNWRFELDGLKAADLSNSGRPIGVFLRLATGEFVYTVIKPGPPGYAEMDALLTARNAEPANQMRRTRVTAGELLKAWPDAPILDAALPAL